MFLIAEYKENKTEAISSSLIHFSLKQILENLFLGSDMSSIILTCYSCDKNAFFWVVPL